MLRFLFLGLPQSILLVLPPITLNLDTPSVPINELLILGVVLTKELLVPMLGLVIVLVVVLIIGLVTILALHTPLTQVALVVQSVSLLHTLLTGDLHVKLIVSHTKGELQSPLTLHLDPIDPVLVNLNITIPTIIKTKIIIIIINTKELSSSSSSPLYMNADNFKVYEEPDLMDNLFLAKRTLVTLLYNRKYKIKEDEKWMIDLRFTYESHPEIQERIESEEWRNSFDTYFDGYERLKGRFITWVNKRLKNDDFHTKLFNQTYEHIDEDKGSVKVKYMKPSTGNNQVGNKQVTALGNEITADRDIKAVIVITNGKFTPDADKIFNSIRGANGISTVEKFMLDDLTFTPVNHVLNPYMEVISKEQKRDLINSTGVSAKNFPVMKSTDPNVYYNRWERGTMIRVVSYDNPLKSASGLNVEYKIII